MVFKKRQFANSKKIDLAEVAPYLLHLGIVVAVTVYVVAGAWAIREIEAAEPNSTNTTPTGEPRTRRASELSDQRPMYLQKLKMNRTRNCVLAQLHSIRISTNCSKTGINNFAFIGIDDCYKNDLRGRYEEEKEVAITTTASTADSSSNKAGSGIDLEVGEDGLLRWRFMDSTLFCFTVITTIGYGNVAPKTFNGRLFVIFYGLIGVPFTMLAIANLGKFLAALLKSWTRPLIRCFGRIHKRFFTREYSAREKQRLMDDNHSMRNKLESAGGSSDSDEEDEEEDENNNNAEDTDSADAFVLLFAFIVYIVAGSAIIIQYETTMTYFEAMYFNFVTLTTIGLGDLVPQNETFVVFTLLYCAIGLALTTIAIEIAADTLKKLHYFGRKIENVGNVKVWFGGQQISMKQLVKNLGDQFNVPVEQLQQLNLNQFVDDAMRVEAGELATLRKDAEPYMSSAYWRALEGSTLNFVDDDDVIAMQANRSQPPPPPPVPPRYLQYSDISAEFAGRVVCDLRDREADLRTRQKKGRPPKKRRFLHRPTATKTPSAASEEEEEEKVGGFSRAARARYQAYRSQWMRYRTTRILQQEYDAARGPDQFESV